MLLASLPSLEDLISSFTGRDEGLVLLSAGPEGPLVVVRLNRLLILCLMSSELTLVNGVFASSPSASGDPLRLVPLDEVFP